MLTEFSITNTNSLYVGEPSDTRVPFLCELLFLQGIALFGLMSCDTSAVERCCQT